MEKSFLYSFFWLARELFMLKKKLLFNEQQTAEAERSRNLNGFGCLEFGDSDCDGGVEGGCSDGDQSFKTNGL